MNRNRLTYKSTMVACFFGIFLQAVISNLVAVLFIPLRELYGLDFAQLGIIITVNFISQVAADIIFSGLIDKIGYRPLAVGAGSLALLGLVLLAMVPTLFGTQIFVGLLIATFFFAFSGGLLEVLLSPIVDSFEENRNSNGGAMAFMHSFYAWGQVIVVVLTTLFIFLCGSSRWQMIVGFWAMLPLIPMIMFLIVPLNKTLKKEERVKTKHVAFSKYFIVCMLAIMFGAGSELVMNQWSSAFVEKGLAVPKIVGDMLGMAMFAVMMGIGRLFYGIKGKKLNLGKCLIFGSTLTFGCYILTALSPIPALAIVTCALTGLGASLLWPGVISSASLRFPQAGAWMFAILAMAGDIGGALFPAVTGIVSDGAASSQYIANLAVSLGLTTEQLALRIGLLVGAICPALALVCHIILYKTNKKSEDKEPKHLS